MLVVPLSLSLLGPLSSCALLSVLSWAGHVVGVGAGCALSLSPAPSLPLSVSGCLRICLCRCPCVYLTALDKRPLRPAILRKGLPYGAEMEPPRLPEALRRRPGRRSAAFGDSGGAWGCSGGVSGRSLERFEVLRGHFRRPFSSSAAKKSSFFENRAPAYTGAWILRSGGVQNEAGIGSGRLPWATTTRARHLPSCGGAPESLRTPPGEARGPPGCRHQLFPGAWKPQCPRPYATFIYIYI